MRTPSLFLLMAWASFIISAVPAESSTNLSFSPKADYATGVSPIYVATGDFNGDGFADFVTVDNASDSLSVFLGRGDGTFRPRTAYPVGSSPWSVAVADLDGDGILDLAAANGNTAAVSVLHGIGDGTFEPRVDIPIGFGATSVAVGDMNSDGMADLALVTRTGVAVLLGIGDGAFGPLALFPSDVYAVSVILADLDGGSVLDAVTADYGSIHHHASESVYLGAGGGALQPRVSYSLGLWPIGIVSGDFDHDGHADLAASSEGSGVITISLNNGDGTFRTASRKVGTDAGILAEGDLDLDGVLDLVMPGRGDSSAVFALLGNGDGTFAEAQTFPTGFAPYAAAVADLNGDHRPDIVTANVGANTASVLLNATPVVSSWPVAHGLDLSFGYPNPTRAGMTIPFSTPIEAKVELSIYDVSGRFVRTLLDGLMPAGAHSVNWDLRTENGSGAPAGVYFSRLRVWKSLVERQITVIR